MERAEPILDGAGLRDPADGARAVPHAGPTRVLDDAEPAVPRTRIDPQDSHSTRDSIAAISSSEISKLAWTCWTSSLSSRFSTSLRTFSAVSPWTWTVLLGRYTTRGAPTGSLDSSALCTWIR